MSKINPIKFTAAEELQNNTTKQTQQSNKSLFNFDTSEVKDGYSAMGLELSADSVQSTDTGRRLTIKRNPDGTKTTTSYYDDGRIDEVTIRDKNREIKEALQYSYGYTTLNGKKDVPVVVIEHNYLENGINTSTVISRNVNDKEVLREEFTFTDDGGDTKSFARYIDGKLESKDEYEFYENGQEKEARHYDKNNELEELIEYTYPKDANGKIIATVSTKTDLKTGKVTVHRNEEQDKINRK